jgi:hypothetical protein
MFVVRDSLHLLISLIHDIKGHTESKFLPFMSRLRFFEIDIDLGSSSATFRDLFKLLMGSLCISLISPATLEYLKLNISSFGDSMIEPDFYDIFCDDLRDADVWRHLDSITTHPTGSRLQRVDIKINYSFYDEDVPDGDDASDAVLDSLPLLRTKGILFVEAFIKKIG